MKNYNYNEYLSYCREKGLNPMDEKVLTEFKNLKDDEKQSTIHKVEYLTVKEALGEDVLNTKIDKALAKKLKEETLKIITAIKVSQHLAKELGKLFDIDTIE